MNVRPSRQAHAPLPAPKRRRGAADDEETFAELVDAGLREDEQLKANKRRC